MVGGGGLIQIPALFAAYPGTPPATLFGTNKLASVFGTANAAWRYSRQITLPWRMVLPAALAAFAFSYVGAAAVSWFPPAAIRPLILLLLIFATVYTLRRKDFGQFHRPLASATTALASAALLGAAIGFYDGFFGPGTGSFLIFLFVRFFGFDFLHASAAAKVVNVATNVAALAWFIPDGKWLPLLALLMALANVGGSVVGSRLALKHGSRLVRQVFIVVASLLIVRFAWDTVRTVV